MNAFDPRSVPVVSTGADLPAIAPHVQTAQALRQRFATPPIWRPEVVFEKKFMQRETAHAAVLLPIMLRDTPTVLLTLRTLHLSTHSGQIAFPGGRCDAQDASPSATALREAHEEVGLAPRYVQVLGELPTYTTGSSFIVTPVVALVEPPPHPLQANPHEVAEVFEVPLAFLLNPAHHRLHRMYWQGVQREWFSMPYPANQHLGEVGEAEKERFIWGATAGILRNFYRFMSA